MRILSSAYKHGITDDQITSALLVPMRYVQQPGRLLVIGADSSGALLEIVVVDSETDDERVIHADVLRPKFHKYL